MASFLILFMMSFTEQKFLVLVKSTLLILSFMDRVFGVESRKSSPDPRSSGFSMAPSRIVVNFVVH